MIVLDIASLATTVAWFWIIFSLLPKLEERRPGFSKYLVDNFGHWPFTIIVGMTILYTGTALGVFARWMGLEDASRLLFIMMPQLAGYMWLRYKMGVKLDRSKIY